MNLTIHGHHLRISLRPASRQDPVYHANFTLPSGRRMRPRLGTTDRDEAEAILEQFVDHDLPGIVAADLAELEAAAPAPPGSPGPRLTDLVDHYLTVVMPNRRAVPRSIDKARYELRAFTDWCASQRIGRLQQLNRLVLDRYAATLQHRHPKTARNYLATVRAMLNAAEASELIDRNPVRVMPLPKVPEVAIEPLTASEIAQVLRICQTDPTLDGARWIALTGQRPSDTVTLRVASIDLERGIVSRGQTKTKRLAQFPICPPALELVRNRIRDGRLRAQDLVFHHHGHPLSTQRLYDRFQAAMRRAAFPRQVNFKLLRHSFAYALANATPPCPLPQLQVLMGHADIKMTMRYVRPGDPAPYLQAYAARVSEP